MAVQNATYIKGQTDLNLAGTYDVGVAPSAPWSAASTLVFDEGGPVVFTNEGALAGINFASVKVQPGFSSNLGTATAPIQLWVNNSGASLLDYNGAGQSVYLAAGSTNDVNELWFRPVGQCVGSMSGVDYQGYVYVESGAWKIPSTTTLVDFRVAGSGQLEIAEHASDAARNGYIFGRSRVVLRRDFTGVTKVGVGSEIVLDLDGTFTGSIECDGGTVTHIRGAIAIQGNSGRYAARGLKKIYAVTFSDTTPDFVEEYGPVVATFTRTKTWGKGSSKP